jgi:hypothetical protein
MNRTTGACGMRRMWSLWYRHSSQPIMPGSSGLTDAMDLARMAAILELIEPLAGEGFRIWKQTRTGLLSYPLDPQAARGHLAASIYLQMALKPHIIHIVGHTEAHHAATAEDVIEASQIARRSIENAVHGAPDMTFDPAVQRRKAELLAEARITLEAIHRLASPQVADPWTDAASLAKAVTSGILDAPQLKNNPIARGQVRTHILNGMCIAVDSNGRPLSESERLITLLKEQA